MRSATKRSRHWSSHPLRSARGPRLTRCTEVRTTSMRACRSSFMVRRSSQAGTRSSLASSTWRRHWRRSCVLLRPKNWMDACCPMSSDNTPLHNLWRAFDEAQFSASNTLNLRESLPTVDDARFRTEQWLRERQVSRAGKVLLITGRGNNSPDGVSPVREGIRNLFPLLRRKGVVTEWKEHSPGAFVISLAPISTLLDAPRRRRDRNNVPAMVTPASIQALEPATIVLLRKLAQRSLEVLGAQVTDNFLEAEMLSKFSALAAGIQPGRDGELRLREAMIEALDDLDD